MKPQIPECLVTPVNPGVSLLQEGQGWHLLRHSLCTAEGRGLRALQSHTVSLGLLHRVQVWLTFQDEVLDREQGYPETLYTH